MQPRLSQKRNAALTLFEVCVAIGITAVLAAMLLPALSAAKRKASRVWCSNNLKQIGLAFKIWEDDHQNLFPMGISATNGGSMESVQAGKVVSTFQILSNELCTPKIPICSGDRRNQGDLAHMTATNFYSLASSNISYFVGSDITNELNSHLILSGDSNLKFKGLEVKSGLLEMSNLNDTNWYHLPIDWTEGRHGLASGNLLLTDGRVEETYYYSLQIYLQQTGLATNRFAIP